jgi:hypothetical protein
VLAVLAVRAGSSDGQASVDLDEMDLVCIDQLPSWARYQDSADFADGITDDRAGRRLARAIRHKAAFRRFKDELHEEPRQSEVETGERSRSRSRSLRQYLPWLGNQLCAPRRALRHQAGALTRLPDEMPDAIGGLGVSKRGWLLRHTG